MRLIIAFLSGALFAAGLVVSGLSSPARVQGFLDIFGNWDPTLAFVMGAAILPMAIAWRFAGRKSLSGECVPAPKQSPIDSKLIAGSAMFGLGWGIGGYCPGPAIATIGISFIPVAYFLAAMIVGIWIARWINSKAA